MVVLSECRRAPQGTEAGTAKTEGLGLKDDGPVGEADAPVSDPPSNLKSSQTQESAA